MEDNTNVLLISEATLKEYSLINQNIDGLFILPAIRTAQDLDLSTVIGPALLNKLQDMVADGSITEEANKKYKLLLDKYITPYLAWSVMTAIQLNINFKLTNSGVIQNQDERKSAIDYRSGKELIAQYEKYTSSYAMKLKNYLCSHSNDYPEYRKVVDFEGEEDPMLCSIFLDGNSTYNRRNYIGK